LLKVLFNILFFFFGFALPLKAQVRCEINKVTFKSGEKLTYEIYYHWGMIWANSGESVFSVKHDTIKNKKVFHIVGEGSTYKSYDWFYKVRDKFESWIDTATLKPLRYIRNCREGSNRVYNDNYFNYNNKKALCFKVIKNKVKKDSVKINECTFDVLTMIYYARCIDYSKYKAGAKIPISLYLDGEVHDTLYIRYLGIESIKTALGEKNCIIFSPLLISGTIFSGGEGMKVWVTNDEKKIPVFIKTPIVVGEVQVKIKEIKN